MSPEKICNQCGRRLPETNEYFKPKGNGRYDGKCRDCLRGKRREAKKRARERTAQSVEDDALASFLSKASQGGENIPHSAELLERTMEYFGGSSGFAALIVKQYFDSPPGSGTRTKILETCVRLTLKNTEMGGAKKPMDQWTDDELEQELDDRLKRVAMQFQGRIVDASTEETASLAASFSGPLRFIPEVATEGFAEGVSQQADRSAEDVSADPSASGDAQMHGE
jgi:hypothetical protein